MSIQRVLRSDGGGCAVSLSCSQRPAAYGDDSGRSLCQSLCLAVIMANLEVLECLFKNQRLLVITPLINL